MRRNVSGSAFSSESTLRGANELNNLGLELCWLGAQQSIFLFLNAASKPEAEASPEAAREAQQGRSGGAVPARAVRQRRRATVAAGGIDAAKGARRGCEVVELKPPCKDGIRHKQNAMQGVGECLGNDGGNPEPATGTGTQEWAREPFLLIHTKMPKIGGVGARGPSHSARSAATRFSLGRRVPRGLYHFISFFLIGRRSNGPPSTGRRNVAGSGNQLCARVRYERLPKQQQELLI